jgi:hypothetical protein
MFSLLKWDVQPHIPGHKCGGSELLALGLAGTRFPQRRGTRTVREFPSHRGLTLGQANLFQGVGDGGGQGLGLIVGRGPGVGGGLGVGLVRGVGVGLAVDVDVAVAVAVGVADGA